MANRRVRSTRKDDRGDIISLCNDRKGWSPRAKEDAISDIQSGKHTYFVKRAGFRTKVEVVKAMRDEYSRLLGP